MAWYLVMKRGNSVFIYVYLHLTLGLLCFLYQRTCSELLQPRHVLYDR